ncbi:MAG: cytochrome c3 family protein [Nitrospirota bacterium]
MKNHGNNLRVYATALYIFIFIFTYGCDAYTKRKVLVFLFPPLKKEEKVEIKKEGEEKATPVKKEKAVITQLAYFIHGPKAENQCYQCHESSNSLAFRKTDSKDVSSALKTEESMMSGRLVTPLTELCIACHNSKSQKIAGARGLLLHGPVANGECTLCHEPHQSLSQFLLLKKNSIELCTECHKEGYIKKTPKHMTSEECISCHNPHAGKNSFLLKTDYNEVF